MTENSDAQPWLHKQSKSKDGICERRATIHDEVAGMSISVSRYEDELDNFASLLFLKAGREMEAYRNSTTRRADTCILLVRI